MIAPTEPHAADFRINGSTELKDVHRTVHLRRACKHISVDWPAPLLRTRQSGAISGFRCCFLAMTGIYKNAASYAARLLVITDSSEAMSIMINRPVPDLQLTVRKELFR